MILIGRSLPVMVSPLLSPIWLRQHLLNGLRNIRILDATWHFDKSRNARHEYLQERIEGSVFFDIEEVSDQGSPYPDMLPTPEEFANHVGKLGVDNEHHVVVYDNNSETGLLSAPRVWWMFRVYGHGEVSVLDGGLPNWKARGFPTSHGTPRIVTPAPYKAGFNPSLVRTFEQMMDNFTSKKEQVMDARSDGRFEGTDPEPRPSLPSGHMIGAHNIPYKSLMNPETKIMQSKHHIQEVFQKAGIDLSQPLVATCGSGMTAAILAFGAHMLGKDIPIYDGSWTEWVQRAPPGTMKLGVKGEDIEKAS